MGRGTWALAVSCVLGWGCGGDAAPTAPIVGGDGGVRWDGGLPPIRDTGTTNEGDGAVVVDGTPKVEILSPLPAEDSDSEDVLVGTSVKVQCKATAAPGGEPVASQGVSVRLYIAEEVKPHVEIKANATDAVDVYESTLSLSDLPTGPVIIECVAEDLSAQPLVGQAAIKSLVDKGPRITFLYPQQGSYVRGGTGTGEDEVISFRVEPVALDESDPGAEIANIQVAVGGRPVSGIMESASQENVYSFGIDFASTELFPSGTPETLDLRVTATNSRQPTGAAAASELSVGIDSQGPEITLVSPVPRGSQLPPIVSGKADIIIEVKDALAGVDGSSVSIEIGASVSGAMTPLITSPVEGTTARYKASFQTADYPGLSRVQLNFKAQDLLGQPSRSSGSPIDIDTVPPWISMDPPPIRERRYKTNPVRCSGTFDPLGEAINDGARTSPSSPRSFFPRAIVWDRPLDVSAIDRYAMVDTSSVQLFVQHNTEVPLLIDSDGDGECDAINAQPDDASKAPATLALQPIAPTGTAKRSLPSDFSEDPVVEEPYCFTDSTNQPPNLLCGGSTMTRVTKHEVEGTFPVVYAYAPNAPGKVGCVGTEYQSPKTGWLCMVVQAKDNAGNIGFSAPLRACVDIGDGACPSDEAAYAEQLNALSCTDGCAIPDWFLPNPTGVDGPMPRILNFFE